MCYFVSTVFFLLSISLKSVLSANILYIANVPSPSHHIWNRALAFELANRGHNVTYIGPDEDKLKKPQNYTHILMEGIYEKLGHEFNINEMGSYGPIKMIMAFHDWSIFQCEINMKTNGLHMLLNYPSDFKFDLVIIDNTCGTCFYPLIHRFNYPPTIAVTAFLLPNYISFMMGNHLFPTYLPWHSLPYTTEMSFTERFWNFIYTYFDLAFKYVNLYPRERKLMEEVFGVEIPPTEKLERHISLLLANTDPLLDHPQPLIPNIIPVGGLHTRKPNELPKDLKDIVNNAKHGIILFSLGTNIRSDKLGEDSIREILNAFSRIKETVIWKFESEMENLPENVIILKWLPQNDILGHPNTKLFIGHGGALSTQETMYHGVPMVAVPFIVDQYINAKIIVNKKCGVYVDYKRIALPDYFYKKIRKALDSPLYSENIKRLSKIFRDRPETPLERGVYWVEYVLRHGGAEFLSTSARDLPFYKSLGLDIMAFLILIFCVIAIVLRQVFVLVLQMFVSKKKQKIL